MLKILLHLSVALSVFAFAAVAQTPPGLQNVEGKPPAPNVQFLNADGQRQSVSDFKGKLVVLNIWATWCAPCVKELPSLVRLSAQLPKNEFAVVAVSQDKGGQAIVKSFLNRIGVDGLEVFFDPAGRVFREFGGRGMPTTYVINRESNVISRLEGPAEWDDEQIVKYLLSLE